jgi:hypothetical protein
MSWFAPSQNDVLNQFLQKEVDAINAAQQSTTLVSDILSKVVDEIRGYIFAGGYPLGDDGSLPAGLHNDAIAIARWRLLISLPSLKMMQTPERKETYELALKKLDKIAAQQWPVELPDAVVSEFSPDGNWNSENKLLMRGHPVPPPLTQGSETAGSYANS